MFVAPDRNALIGMPTPTEEQRLRICRDLANVLALLHSDDLKITFGDLNAKNELFRLDAEPHVMLIDCDAARVRGDMGQQPNTPGLDSADRRVAQRAERPLQVRVVRPALPDPW